MLIKGAHPFVNMNLQSPTCMVSGWWHAAGSGMLEGSVLLHMEDDNLIDYQTT